MARSQSAPSPPDGATRRPAGRADPIDLLVVGPAAAATGGIARYVDEQRRRLPDDVDVRAYDTGTSTDLLDGSALGVALSSLAAALLYPFQRKPDVAHVHTSHGASFYRETWYVLVAALLWRRPVVVHVHGSSFDEFVAAEGVVGALQRLVFGLSARVIVLSPYWAEVLSDRVPADKIEVLPNAVDPDEYDPGYGADPPHVAFVSNHIARKGVPELVTALERLDEAGVEFRASIAGSGPLAHRAEDLADAVPSVEYLGYVSEAEKRRLLAEASIYALPTHAEGLPIGLLEGMAAGNAVVTTGVGSIPEVVDDEMGRMVDPGDVDGLTEALRELIENPSTTEAMGRRSRDRVEAEYSWPRVTGRLADTYRSLAPGASGAPAPAD